MSDKTGTGPAVERFPIGNVTLSNKIYNHQMYKTSGGFLYKEDYKAVLNKSREIFLQTGLSGLKDNDGGNLSSKVISMMKMAGIDLPDKQSRDPRMIVYSVLVDMLRTNPRPGLAMRYKHINKDRDELLLAESLRILGQSEQLQSLKSTYSHIRQ